MSALCLKPIIYDVIRLLAIKQSVFYKLDRIGSHGAYKSRSDVSYVCVYLGGQQIEVTRPWCIEMKLTDLLKLS